jgi:hypothetical protein
MRTTINGNPHEKILKTKDLAALFRVDPITIAMWRAQKRGPPYYKINGRVHYREKDVMDWLEGSKREA